jgi:acyl-CoA-binding protein
MASEPATTPDNLEAAFAHILQLIAETPVTREIENSFTVQSRLYGLYSHIKKGPCVEKAPFIINALKYSKWKAYKACTDLSKEQAMLEYVQLAAAPANWFGKKCRAYLVEQQILPPDDATQS